MMKKSAMPTGSVFLLVLFLAVLCSAVAIVYATHKNRVLLNELYANTSEYNKAQVEWGRLVLEQSAWSSYSRVEKIAVSHLNMHIPSPSEIRILGR